MCVNWLKESWHKIGSTLGRPPTLPFQIRCLLPNSIASTMIEYQWSIFTLRMPYFGTLRSFWSSGGGKSEVMTWGFGWWLWTTRITHPNPWKLYRFDGFSFERNWTSRPRKTPKPATCWGKTILSYSFCLLHPLAITFGIGKKQSHNPRHMYSNAGIDFQWNLLNLTLTC